jgi:hypothetical protein
MVLLADLLPRSRATSTFTSLALSSSEPLASLLSSPPPPSSPLSSLVVLAPLNSAIDALGAKVWQLYPPAPTELAAATGGDDVGAWYEGEQGRARARRNEEIFAQRHVLVVAGEAAAAGGWEEGRANEARSVDDAWDGRVWWEARGGDKRVIMPGEIPVVSVEQPRAENGELWIINGTVDGKKQA